MSESTKVIDLPRRRIEFLITLDGEVLAIESGDEIVDAFNPDATYTIEDNDFTYYGCKVAFMGNKVGFDFRNAMHYSKKMGEVI